MNETHPVSVQVDKSDHPLRKECPDLAQDDKRQAGHYDCLLCQFRSVICCDALTPCESSHENMPLASRESPVFRPPGCPQYTVGKSSRVNMAHRHRLGIAELDEMLGGGLIPGTLTVVLGTTGIGKTQLGLQYLHQGEAQEGASGVLFDMTSRGDSQNHAEYARRMFQWELRERPSNWSLEEPAEIWTREHGRWDALHLFHQSGRRVTRDDLGFDEQRAWKAELNRKLTETIAFYYGNFCQGVRRCVIDGIEPSDRASDSFQFELFEYIYHQILRKEYDWVARDLLRAQFRNYEEQVRQHAYSHEEMSCLMLCTTHEVMLENLISRPIETGDVLSNANTIILMGKVREGTRMGRALYVAKHRGSRCDESIRPYEIHENGLRLL